MKTLVLLSALVQLAFQVQAGPIQDAEEETKTEEQPADEDEAVSFSFEGLESSALQNPGSRNPPVCVCRKTCELHEIVSGPCPKILWINHQICCRK